MVINYQNLKISHIIIYLTLKMKPERQSQQPQPQKLSKQQINDAFQNSKKNNITFEVLANVFHTLKLLNEAKRSPGLNAEQINKNIANKMVPTQVLPPRGGPFLDPRTVYPLNKAGAFGTLLRECTIVEKGIEEKEGNGAPKLKEITDFNNRIQTQTTKNNQKLEWIKENKQYPFRLILKDKQKKVKAIYFKTKQQAEKVRIHYVNKLLYKGNFKKTMQEAELKFKSKVAQNLRMNMAIYKNERKSKQIQESRSRKSQAGDRSRLLDRSADQDDKSKKEKSKEKSKEKEPGDERKSELMMKSQKGYSSDAMNLITNRLSSDSKGKSEAGRNLVMKMEQGYKKNLFEAWLRRAREQDDRKKISQHQQSMRNTKTHNLQSKSKPNPGSRSLSQSQPSSLTFHSIQLLKQSNLLIKPLAQISLYKGQSPQPITQSKYNTIIQKKEPYLSYQLILQAGPEHFQTKQKITEYEIGIKIVDYLSNTEICNERIQLKGRVLSQWTYLIDEDRTVRLKLGYASGDQQGEKVDDQDNPEGVYLEIKGLSEKVIEDIRNYWESESIKRGYYNTSKDINIIQIFQLCEQPPKFWSLGLPEPTYSIISLLSSASTILSFKLPQSILPILHTLQPLYPSLSELIEILLSILLNYMRPYYCISEFSRLNRLHTMLGLQGEIQLQGKIGLQMEVVRRILGIQCAEFGSKMGRRGIGYLQVLYQYLYEMYSRNFKRRVLVEIWNFIFKDPTLIPVYMLLISIWLIKFYSDKLKKCHRLTQLTEVLQSQQTCQADTIIRELLILREKYFPISNSSTIMDSFKEMFNTRPLEQVVIEFYKRETERLDRKKENRNIEKNVVLKKLSGEVAIELPKYPLRTYCLHIYFYKLPPVSGSLYIKTNNIEYQCLNITKTKYFIIADVSTEIILEFINNRSDEYTCQLQCMQGINRYSVELQSSRDSQVYRVEYICGLLTDGHVEILKKNRKFQHFVGAFVRQDQVFQEFLRPSSQCAFLAGLGKRLDKDDLGKKIKVVFSSGSKNFDEIEFYLRWIYICPITLPEKLKLINQFAKNISQEYFLCNYASLRKIFLSLFLSMLQFPITPLQFQSFYSDSLALEFKAPKILKCRLVLPNGSSHKLQHIATQYLSTKAHTHLHQDIVIGELIALVQKEMEAVLATTTEAVLALVYSSYGEVKSFQVPVVKKKGSKEVVVDQGKFEVGVDQSNDISTAEPEILVTEILPTFSKISTILDFVNNSKNVQSLGKSKQAKNIPQSINLLKNCDQKYKKVILMRYQEHPCKISIPFLDYYHELICDAVPPPIPKNLFLNNLQTDIKTICTFNGILNFSDNKKIQATRLDRTFGLYGNFRILPNKTQSLYFVSVLPEEEVKSNALLFVNYGYGTFRWEPCTVLGYFYSVKEKETNLNKEKKPKKNFIVRHGRTEKVYRDFQLRMDPHVEQNLPDVEQKSSSPLKASSIRRPAQMTTSKRQLGTISKRNFDEPSGKKSQY